jgi:hypothetical protein
MELKVVIDKKFAFMIFGAILILAGAIYGYAYGGNNPLVMGHSGEEIDVIVNNETISLNDALGNLISSDCRVVTQIGLYGNSIASCAEDEILMGGGGECETTNANCGICSCGNLGYLHLSKPLGNSWQADCYKFDATAEVCAKAYALCCKFS